MFLDAGQIIAGYFGVDENGLPYINVLNRGAVNINRALYTEYDEEKLQIIQGFILDYTEDDIEKMFNINYDEFEKLNIDQKFELINLHINQKQKKLAK